MIINRIYGKKGIEVSLKFIIMWIILPIIAGLFIWMIFSSVASASSGMFKDDLCRFNVGLVSHIGVGGRFLLGACNERNVKVDANDWDKCDPDGKFRLKEISETDEYDAKRKCAAQQFYNLGARCWYMYGQGRLNLLFLEAGRLPCFKAVVRDLTGTIGEIEVTEASYKVDKCKYLPNNDCDASPISDGGCGYCGRSDNIDFSEWFSTAEIKTGQTYYVCFDEAGGGDDQIDYREKPC